MDFSPESVGAQLSRITASRVFRNSERMQRFLTFCVQAAMRGEAPKEYTVGTAVFDRKADYDPRVDPIVRVEARRLREKLQAYYAEPGAGDDVVIEFPKGSYVPVLRRRHNQPTASEQPRATSIAVLPFTNLSRDPDDEYFSDGLTEELIHRLTRIQGLRVLAWPSASRLRGRDDDAGGIRHQLDIDFVLRGSVRRGAGGVRITAQLLDAGTGEVRWSEGYSRPLSDLLALQESIAASIVSTLELALGRPAKSEPTNPESHNLCLKGRYLVSRRTVESIRKSIACYEEAASIDPKNAVAFAGWAGGLILLAEYADVAPAATMERARQHALRSLELDPLLAEAYVSLAMIRSHIEWDWAGSEELYRKALDLNPGYARAHHWYGLDHLAMLARWDEARTELHAAQRLDPLSAIILEGRAHLAMLQRDYDGALGELRAIVELEPAFQKAHAGMGRVYALQGRYQEALDAFEKAMGQAEAAPSLLAAKGQVHGLLGQRDRALACLEELRERSREKRAPLAVVYLGLGQHDAALECLELAAERREPSIVACGVHPLYDLLRDHPRFQNLVERIGSLP